MRTLFSFTLILTFTYACAQNDKAKDYVQSIQQKNLKSQLFVYASDYFQGRESGTIGQKRAVDFLRDFYRRHEITPANGTQDYYQPMVVYYKGNPIETENVAAVVKGSEYPDEYIVVSSHLDHEGSKNGEIYNGADDDGSGSIALLELANAFQKAANEGNGPKRSILFLHFTGEEKGLLGSKHYVENPLYPLEDTVANLNIDMIGRVDPSHRGGREDYVYLIGTDQLSSELHTISENANKESVNLLLDYKYNNYDEPECIYFRSDHYNFARNNIPVIFYFNGVHEDYHKPTDTPDKINYPLYHKRIQLVFFTLWKLANNKERIRVDNTVSKQKLVNCQRYEDRY